jgi:hypothetical protein
MHSLLVLLSLMAAGPQALQDNAKAPVLARLFRELVAVDPDRTGHTFSSDFTGDGRPDVAVFVKLDPARANSRRAACTSWTSSAGR